MRFKPNMYKRDIFDINYSLLKKLGKKCLIFDLDNTLALIDDKSCPDKVKKLILKLKKDFKVFVVSNNTYKRIKPYLTELGIEGFSNAFKPSYMKLKKISNRYKFKKNEMVMIGDQIVTDIQAGNRFGILTILVDPLGKKDLKITGLNRFLENKVIKYYSKDKIFERGNYYE